MVANYLSSYYFSFLTDRTKRPSGSEELSKANSDLTEKQRLKYYLESCGVTVYFVT